MAGFQEAGIHVVETEGNLDWNPNEHPRALWNARRTLPMVVRRLMTSTLKCEVDVVVVLCPSASLRGCPGE